MFGFFALWLHQRVLLPKPQLAPKQEFVASQLRGTTFNTHIIILSLKYQMIYFFIFLFYIFFSNYIFKSDFN